MGGAFPSQMDAATAFLEAVREDPTLLSAIGDNPFVNRMEEVLREFLGLPGRRVVAVSSATVGLASVLRALGVGPGDEVITGAAGWGQTLHAILEVGATPVLVDANPESPNVDLDAVQAAVSPRTRAVLAAELSGIPLDWEFFGRLREAYGLDIVLDAAQSFGASHSGPLPTAIVFSFGRGKLISGGEGGAVAVSDASLYDVLLVATQHPIRALQNIHSALPFDAVDSVAPNGRIHPFAAALIATGICWLHDALPTLRGQTDAARAELVAAGFPPVETPPGTCQAPGDVPVRTHDGGGLDRFCIENGWTCGQTGLRNLATSPTVEFGEYLPALRHLGKSPRRILVGRGQREYPWASFWVQALRHVKIDG